MALIPKDMGICETKVTFGINDGETDTELAWQRAEAAFLLYDEPKIRKLAETMLLQVDRLLKR